MKIEQDRTYIPIKITLETDEEAKYFWDMIHKVPPGLGIACEMATMLSNWFSNEAQL